MARIVVLFTVIFLVLTVTHGRFIVPEQTISPEETVTVLPEPRHTIIDLPSEKPDSEQAKTVDFKHYDTMEADPDLDSFPLTMTSFRPVNGHFPRHPLVPFRHKHDCHFHKRFRPSNPRFQRKRYISYGNDVVLSDERTGFDTDQSDSLGPKSRRARFSGNGAESKEHVEYFRKPRHDNREHEQEHDDEHHHRYYYNHRHHRRGEEEERRGESEEKEGGLVKRFRKFLTKF
ncbi:hypothetical protein HRI_004290400 [Hibiscus trionum]|uniref:Uncharacterized protein n=1 Tax=Hibiscus trionum TaxID=183268 RepID=A0A9W7J3Y4_HIBTR|nr:hypothetical protein HRI_004290400 [Hibiscus trionum]